MIGVCFVGVGSCTFNGDQDEKLKGEEDERRSQMIRILLANCLWETGLVNSQVLPCNAELLLRRSLWNAAGPITCCVLYCCSNVDPELAGYHLLTFSFGTVCIRIM